MKEPQSGSTTGMRAVECAIIAGLALLARDALRSDLSPLWQVLRLLFGS